jgi:hypothetical protein
LLKHNPPQHTKHKQVRRIEDVEKPFIERMLTAGLTVVEEPNNYRHHENADLPQTAPP